MCDKYHRIQCELNKVYAEIVLKYDHEETHAVLRANLEDCWDDLQPNGECEDKNFCDRVIEQSGAKREGEFVNYHCFFFEFLIAKYGLSDSLPDVPVPETVAM